MSGPCGTSSAFLYHSPCPSCGSSDACAVYSDGSSYCFSCRAYTGTGGSGSAAYKEHRKRMAGSNLIPDGEFKAIGKRKLSAETLQKFNYSIGTHRGKTVHIAPYYDKKGLLVAQHIRYPDKEFAWTGESKDVQLFGQNIWRNNGGKMLVITEGELDCLSVSQAQGNKYPVVSIPSGASGAHRAIKANLDWIESFEKVVFAFDSDEPGHAAALECAMLLTPGKARLATFPLKDASDMLQAGRTQELISCIWEAKVYRPDGLIAGKDLLEDLLKAPKEGYATPFGGLNEMTRGVRKGELVLFTAGSGIGKSTIVHEIGYHFMMQHGLSLGVIALEESKKRTAERYVGINLNSPIHITREGVAQDDIKAAFDAVFDNDRFWLYDHFGSTNLDNLLGKIRYMIVALGVDFVILDHISIVVSGLDDVEGDERKLIDKLMTKLRSLVEETGAGVIAIVHLKRPDRGPAFTEGRPVALSDLRGSGALEQLSDVVVALERNQQDEETQNLAHLRVLKNRPIGTVGLCGTVLYDPATGRLKEAGADEFFASPTATTPKQTQPEEGEEDF